MSIRRESNQHIHVAFWAKILIQYRTKQSQTLNIVAMAKFLNFPFRD